MDITAMQAIDVHSHFGTWRKAPDEGERYAFINGEEKYLLENMDRARIAFSISSHLWGLFPRGDNDAAEGNRQGIAAASANPRLYLWAIVNPLQPETFAQANELLQHEKCLGIKVHPEEHRYPLKDYGEQLYEFAAKNHAVIEGHSGEEWSLPEDYAVFANRYPETVTIASHLGCGYDGDFRHQIRAVQSSLHGNFYTDTSSAKSMNCNILEIAVGEMGSERLLFGSDSGCYFSPSQRARVDFARIPDADKENILYRNALRVFPRLVPAYEALKKT